MHKAAKPPASRCCALQKFLGGVHQAFEASPAPETTWKGQAENGKGGSHEHNHHNGRAVRAHGSRTRGVAPTAHAAADSRRSRVAGSPQYPSITCKHRARVERERQTSPVVALHDVALDSIIGCGPRRTRVRSLIHCAAL